MKTLLVVQCIGIVHAALCRGQYLHRTPLTNILYLDIVMMYVSTHNKHNFSIHLSRTLNV